MALNDSSGLQILKTFLFNISFPDNWTTFFIENGPAVIRW